MSAVRSNLLRTWPTVAAAAGVVPITYMLGVLTFRSGVVVGAVLVVVLVGLVGAVAAPTHVLPATALVLYVVLPQQLIGYGYFGLTPALLVTLIWALRRWTELGSIERRPPDGWLIGARFAAVCFVLWSLDRMATTTPAVPLIGPTGREWLTSFVVAVVVVLFVDPTRREVDLLIRTLAVVTVVAALFAVVEVAIQQNPVYLPLYDMVGRSLHVDGGFYRASVGFGHPLYAGTFFAVSFAIFFVRWIDDVPASLHPTLAAVAGTAATVSRGALAVVAGTVVVVTLVRAPVLRRIGSDKLGRLALLAPVAIGALVLSGLLEARSGSVEATRSAEVRSDILPEALQLARSSGWLGYGPATADSLASAVSGGAYPMENSLLQILVSLGIPGLLLLVAALGLVAVSAWRSGAANGAVAVVAFTVATAGYNGLESLLPLHTLLGAVLIVCIGPRCAVPERPAPSSPAAAVQHRIETTTP